MTKGKPRTKPDKSYVPAVYDERHCIEIKADGVRCGAFHLDSKLVCAMHDPETKSAILADQRNHIEHSQWLDQQIRQPHDLTTVKGIIQFNNLLIQAVVHKKIDRPTANTTGYLLGTQLQALRAEREEKKPDQTIRDLIGDGVNIEIKMTKDERRAFLTAGSAGKMGQILEHVKEDGRIIETTQNVDGSFSARLEGKPKPPRDMKMPAQEIAQAMNDGGFDITKGEVVECFGSFLGDDKERAPELIGLTDIYEPGNMPESTYHEFIREQIPNEQLAGTLKIQFKCTHCGITTGNTKRWEDKFCPKRMKT